MPLQMCVFSLLNIFFKSQPPWATVVGLMELSWATTVAWPLHAAVRLLQPPSTTVVTHGVKANRRDP
jgi:hypothetical protein